MKTLIGDTYEHKDLIKSKGGVWDSIKKSWSVPSDVFEELAILCLQTQTYNKMRGGTGKKHECCDCGDMVYKGTNCWETGLTH